MADDGFRPIIVKRVKKVDGGHHGGAWKIAYADFVTAMMAFFLLMWLLGSTAKGQLNGIAEYFNNPLKVSMAGGSGSGDSTSVIKGGGRDLTRQTGQVKYGDRKKRKVKYDTTRKLSDVSGKKAELALMDARRLRKLKGKLLASIEHNKALSPFKNQLLIDITTEGLRIQIVDEKNRPMFALSKATLKPYTKKILREIGPVLNEVPNKIALSGHTDATPYVYSSKNYTNWELSADRANASRRELIAGGMDKDKILRVVGLSSAVLMDRENPYNPINRRISIIVLNIKAEESVKKGKTTLAEDSDVPLEDQAIEVVKKSDAEEKLLGKPPEKVEETGSAKNE